MCCLLLIISQDYIEYILNEFRFLGCLHLSNNSFQVSVRQHFNVNVQILLRYKLSSNRSLKRFKNRSVTGPSQTSCLSRQRIELIRPDFISQARVVACTAALLMEMRARPQGRCRRGGRGRGRGRKPVGTPARPGQPRQVRACNVI